jgi:hypothetical protein
VTNENAVIRKLDNRFAIADDSAIILAEKTYNVSRKEN